MDYSSKSPVDFPFIPNPLSCTPLLSYLKRHKFTSYPCFILNPYDEIVVVLVLLLGVMASIYRLPHISKELYSVPNRLTVVDIVTSII